MSGRAAITSSGGRDLGELVQGGEPHVGHVVGAELDLVDLDPTPVGEPRLVADEVKRVLAHRRDVGFDRFVQRVRAARFEEFSTHRDVLLGFLPPQATAFFLTGFIPQHQPHAGDDRLPVGEDAHGGIRKFTGVEIDGDGRLA